MKKKKQPRIVKRDWVVEELVPNNLEYKEICKGLEKGYVTQNMLHKIEETGTYDNLALIFNVAVRLHNELKFYKRLLIGLIAAVVIAFTATNATVIGSAVISVFTQDGFRNVTYQDGTTHLSSFSDTYCSDHTIKRTYISLDNGPDGKPYIREDIIGSW